MTNQEFKIPGGYILLARKLLENPIFNKPELLQLWVYCLEKANHKPKPFIFNNEEIEIKRGQFISGRSVIATDLKQNPNTTYKRLKLLEKLSYLDVKSNNKFSLITCINYELYQNPDNYKYQLNNSQITTKYQPDNTNNNDNNNNNHVCVSNIYNTPNSIEYSDVLSQLQQWNIPLEVIEYHDPEKIKNIIAQVKEKQPKSNSGYFFHLLDKFQAINEPVRVNKGSLIDRKEAGQLMTDLINTGNDLLVQQLREILESDDIDAYELLKGKNCG